MTRYASLPSVELPSRDKGYKYTSLLSVDLSQMYAWSRFEDCMPVGKLVTELSTTGVYFFYIQSSVKYRSWPDMHHCCQKIFPIYQLGKFEDSISLSVT